MVRRRSWWGVGQEEEWRWQEGMGERILPGGVAWGTVTGVSASPHTPPVLVLTLGWPPLKGGQRVDQSRWAPPPILPTLTGASSLPQES